MENGALKSKAVCAFKRGRQHHLLYHGETASSTFSRGDNIFCFFHVEKKSLCGPKSENERKTNTNDLHKQIQRIIILDDNYSFFLQCFNRDRIPKQSSSFSSPREMNGSSSSEELATDGSDLKGRSCCITLKYSFSVFALANRDWAFDL